MSWPPVVVAVAMPAAGVLASASVAPTNAELASTAVPTVNPSTSTSCTLPDVSARAAMNPASTWNRFVVVPRSPVMPVWESSVSVFVSPTVNVSAPPPATLLIDCDATSVRFGIPPMPETSKSPSSVIVVALVAPPARPITIVAASSTKLISVFETPKLAPPAPIVTAFAALGAIRSTALPAVIVALAETSKSPPVMSMSASVPESVSRLAPAFDTVNVPLRSPSTSALMSISPDVFCPATMKLTTSESALSSAMPVSALISISPPSDVTLPLSVTEPSLDVRVILSLSPVVEI